jgi:hypothetical protein
VTLNFKCVIKAIKLTPTQLKYFLPFCGDVEEVIQSISAPEDITSKLINLRFFTSTVYKSFFKRAKKLTSFDAYLSQEGKVWNERYLN